MSGISSFIQSIFANPGQNAAMSQVQGEEGTANLSGALAPTVAGQATTAVGNQASFSPQYNNTLQSFINSFSGADTANLNKMNAGAESNFGASTRLGNSQLASQGLGGSFAAGNTLANQNALNSQLSTNVATVNSPAYQQQELQAVTGAENAGMTQANGSLAQLGGLTSNVFGQPKVPVSQNPAAGIVGQALGLWAANPGSGTSSASTGSGPTGSSTYHTTQQAPEQDG